LNADCRRLPWVLSVLALMGLGCSNDLSPSTTSVVPTPPDVLAPEGPKATESVPKTSKVKGSTPAPTSSAKAPAPEAQGEILLTSASASAEPAQDDSDEPVSLETISASEFKSRIAKNKGGVKYSVVDGWATYCPPCMENFPHLVEMHEKYADKGLRVISVSFDDASSPNDVKAAGEFLKSKKAEFENYIFSDGLGETYEHFDVNTIPAVFVYGPGGKEVKRFSYDDPDHQFTYDEVEAYLKGLLSGDQAEK
jgi:thiol-disulfide isomerase/thioredoxin